MIEILSITDVIQELDGLKAVIFDLDDTLYSEKEYVKSGYKAVADILLPEIEDAESKLWKLFEQKKSAIDELLLSEGIYGDELKQKCLEVYRHHQPNIRLHDGVAEMLMKLRKQSFSLGIVTDGRPEGQRAKIKALDLERYVDHIIVTDELGGVEYRKPNEKAFILMKEQFGVEYSEMCYIGDNCAKDFIAPQNLGMKYIWFNNADGIQHPRAAKSMRPLLFLSPNASQTGDDGLSLTFPMFRRIMNKKTSFRDDVFVISSERRKRTDRFCLPRKISINFTQDGVWMRGKKRPTKRNA